MTQNITSAAAAARETARTQTGQFGTQPLSEADLDLTPGAGSAVQIDDALRALPIHVDDFQVFEPDAPLYSDSKHVLLGAVAEHYAARLFSADVVLPQLLEARDAETMWAGTLAELNAYAAGVDPLTVNDGDTHPGTCEHCETPHLFAPYLPPRIHTGPVMVTVEISPLPAR